MTLDDDFQRQMTPEEIRHSGLLALLEDMRVALRLDVQPWVERAEVDDPSLAEDLYFAFLPTGPLQDHSISIGAGDAFLSLAARFDALCPEIEAGRLAAQRAASEPSSASAPSEGWTRSPTPPPPRPVPPERMQSGPCRHCRGIGYEECNCDAQCMRYPPPCANDDLVPCWICSEGWVECHECGGTGRA